MGCGCSARCIPTPSHPIADPIPCPAAPQPSCPPTATPMPPPCAPGQGHSSPRVTPAPAAALAAWAELVGFSPKLRKPRGWARVGVAAPGGGGRGTTPVSYIPRAGSGLHNSRAAVSALLSASATGRAAAPSPSPWIFAFWGQAGGRGTPAGWLSFREWPGAGGSGWQGWLGLRLRGLPQAPPVSDLGARIPPGWKHPVEGGVGDGDSRDGPVLLLRQRCSLLHPLPPTVLPLPSRRALCRWGN